MQNDAKTTSTKRLKSLLLMSPDCDRFTSFSSSMKALKFTRLPTKENAKKKKKKREKNQNNREYFYLQTKKCEFTIFLLYIQVHQVPLYLFGFPFRQYNI